MVLIEMQFSITIVVMTMKEEEALCMDEVHTCREEESILDLDLECKEEALCIYQGGGL